MEATDIYTQTYLDFYNLFFYDDKWKIPGFYYELMESKLDRELTEDENSDILAFRDYLVKNNIKPVDFKREFQKWFKGKFEFYLYKQEYIFIPKPKGVFKI
jgi:hypothetical protein